MDHVLRIGLLTLLVNIVASSPYGSSDHGSNPNHNHLHHQGGDYGKSNGQSGGFKTFEANGQPQGYPTNTGFSNPGQQGAFGQIPQGNRPQDGSYVPNQQYNGQVGHPGHNGNQHVGGYKTHGY